MYFSGILFGVAALLGYGLDNTVLAFASKKYGYVRASLMLFLMITALSVVPAFFFFSSKNINAYDILLAFAMGTISFVAFVAFAKGFEVGNVSSVASIANGWSAITVILSIVFLNEHPNTSSIIEILLIVIGVVLVAYKHKKNSKIALRKINEDTKYALITMIGWGAYFFLNTILVRRIGWFDAFFLLNAITLAFIFVYGSFKRTKSASFSKQGYALLFIGSLANLIAGMVYNLGVSLNFTAIVAPVASASVILPVLFGIWYLKERPENTQMLGIALIALGIVALSLQ